MKKVRKHKLLNRFTVLGIFLLMIWGMLFYNGIGGFIAGLVSGEDINLATGIISALCAVLALAIYKRWFYPEFEGCLRGGDIAGGLRLSIIFAIYIVLSFILILASAEIGNPGINSIGIGLMAGFGEEVTFRGLPLSYAMRQWRDKPERIKAAAIITSACFGGIHLFNLSAGASLALTIFQVIAATGLGLMLSGIFLRSGNLWFCILAHTINDIVALCDASIVGGVLESDSLTVGNYFDLAFCITLGIIGVYLIRKSKAEDIKAVWDQKWIRIAE